MFNRLKMELDEFSRNDKESQESLEELKNILENNGIELKNEDGKLTFTWYSNDTDAARTRYAGRRKNYLKKEVLEEVRQRMESGEKADDLAAEFGVSRRTLFRRLKEHSES